MKISQHYNGDSYSACARTCWLCVVVLLVVCSSIARCAARSGVPGERSNWNGADLSSGTLLNIRMIVAAVHKLIIGYLLLLIIIQAGHLNGIRSVRT